MSEEFKSEIPMSVRIFGNACDGPMIVYLTGHGSSEETKTLYDKLKNETGKDFVLYEINIEDWDRYLTPWPAISGMKDRAFLGEAELLLKEIEKMIQEKKNHPVYIAGYSLAGLFSLWSMYECNLFDGCACMSGSLWYPEFKDYLEKKELSKKYIYLSLGKKEECTKHPLMKQVGDLTRWYEESLGRMEGIKTELVWHEGGHFTGVPERIEDGLRHLLNAGI